MNKLVKTLVALASSAVVFSSCIDQDAMNDRLDVLEGKIEALEASISAANENAIAISQLLKDSTLIVGITETEGGYELALSDGVCVKVIYGTNLPGITPIIGVNSNGQWIMSVDNGETFTVIPGCANAYPAQAATPQIKIDADGNWSYSIDGGKTWAKVLDAEGKPMKAGDGKEVAGVKTYFQDAVYNAAEGYMTFTLIDGSKFSVPVVSTFYLTVKGFESKAVIEAEQTINYEVESSDVAETAIQAPEGWVVVLSENQLSVTAPAAVNPGEYNVNLFLVSSKGYLKTVVLTFGVL